MSDEAPNNTIQITVSSAEFWHYAAIATVELKSLYKHDKAEAGGLVLETVIGSISFYTDGKQTKITASYQTNEQKRAINTLFAKLKDIDTLSYDYRRMAVGYRFTEILDAYYAAKQRGERPNLRAMAEFAGVNYDSLRQAKVRYDAKLK